MASPAVAKIPPKCHDLADVFEKGKADILPPHLTYNCPNDLQPEAEILFGKISALSEPKLWALHLYLRENFQKGFIYSSKSPADAPIFFVKVSSVRVLTIGP